MKMQFFDYQDEKISLKKILKSDWRMLYAKG